VRAAAFLKAASAKADDGVIELLFRGERLARLGERLCRDESATVSKVATGLFYFGEKGKHFWNEGMRRRQEEERTQWDTVVRNIDDLSVESFEQLLRHLAGILKLNAAQNFRTENPDFSQIIEGESGRTDLAGRFDEFSCTDKRWVRDLFIYVTHSFSRREYKTYTPFVSTTPEFSRAKCFAKKGAKKDEKPCVISLFLHAGQVDRVLRSKDLPSYSTRLSTLGFPPINRLFFEEKEVAFFGAIFPQTIFAIVDLKAKAAFWNPTVFDVPLDAGADVWKEGLPVDQTDFERFMGEQTGYAKGVERSATGDKEIYPP
jgi:hypothetical protein